MKPAILGSYRAQTILGLLQAGVVVAGSLIVVGILKAFGYHDGMEMALQVRLVRHWGFVLFLLPVAWVGLTVYWEQAGFFGRRHTVISGLLLLAGLTVFLLMAAARAASCMMTLGGA